MPTYKLTYFNITGLGEVIRYLFAYGKIDYEDKRINDEDWPVVKPTIYWGQLPTLEIDGKTYHQSLAIARHLAKIVGIAGKTDMEEFLINIALETIHDYRIEALKLAYEIDLKQRPAKLKELNDELLPNILPKLDRLVKENNGYFALGRVSNTINIIITFYFTITFFVSKSQLTVADIYFVAFKPYLEAFIKKDLYDNYENLKKVIENVESIPEIKKWIETRPARIAVDIEKYLNEMAEKAATEASEKE